jgi:hypothetical protein
MNMIAKCAQGHEATRVILDHHIIALFLVTCKLVSYTAVHSKYTWLHAFMGIFPITLQKELCSQVQTLAEKQIETFFSLDKPIVACAQTYANINLSILLFSLLLI